MKIWSLFIIVALCACSVKPKWIKEEMSSKEFKPDTVDYKHGVFGMSPTFFLKADRDSFYGLPFEYRDSCSRVVVRHELGDVYMGCAIYDSTWSLVIKDYGNQAFVDRIRFKHRSESLKTPKYSFNRKTTLKDVKNTFPNSYQFLNLGLGFHDEGCPYWLILAVKDELHRKPYKDYVTLYFDEDKLLYALEYTWNPQYTEEQFEIFLKQEKERKKAAKKKLF
jgi:hypothetical protein